MSVINEKCCVLSKCPVYSVQTNVGVFKLRLYWYHVVSAGLVYSWNRVQVQRMLPGSIYHATGPLGKKLDAFCFFCSRLWPLPFKGKREEFPCKDQYPCVTLNHPAVSIAQLCQSPCYNASLHDSWFPSIVAARVNYPTWQLRFSNILLVAVSINEHTAAQYTYSTHEQTCWQQLPMPQGLVFIRKALKHINMPWEEKHKDLKGIFFKAVYLGELKREWMGWGRKKGEKKEGKRKTKHPHSSHICNAKDVHLSRSVQQCNTRLQYWLPTSYHNLNNKSLSRARGQTCMDKK